MRKAQERLLKIFCIACRRAYAICRIEGAQSARTQEGDAPAESLRLFHVVRREEQRLSCIAQLAYERPNHR